MAISANVKRDRIRRRRLILAGTVGGWVGKGLLFGTRRGRLVIGKGLKLLGRVSPTTRRIITTQSGISVRALRASRRALIGEGKRQFWRWMSNPKRAEFTMNAIQKISPPIIKTAQFFHLM